MIAQCKRGHEFTEENTYVHAKTGARHCRACKRDRPKTGTVEQRRKWRKDWRKRNPHYHRDRERLKKLGVTPEETAAMYEAQEGKCAICKKHMEKPQMDHNHATGSVRELLCANCNMAIGLLEDDTDILESAKSYLLKHKEA